MYLFSNQIRVRQEALSNHLRINDNISRPSSKYYTASLCYSLLCHISRRQTIYIFFSNCRKTGDSSIPWMAGHIKPSPKRLMTNSCEGLHRSAAITTYCSVSPSRGQQSPLVHGQELARSQFNNAIGKETNATIMLSSNLSIPLSGSLVASKCTEPRK